MRPLMAIGLKVLSVFLFIVMAALIKAASADVGAGQAVFFRSFFALPIVLGYLWMMGELRHALRTQHLASHIWRGILGVAAMMMGFASLALLPLPEANAIGFTAPLLTVVFAALILGERVRLIRGAAVVLGLIGVLIITLPQLSSGFAHPALTIGAILALVSATFRAVAIVTVRYLVQRESPSTVVFYFSIISALIGLMTLPIGAWYPQISWVWPSNASLLYLILAGLAGGLGQLMVTTAYRWAEMGVLAPFDYTSLLFATLIGYVVFGELPATQTYLGAPLVVLAGVLIIYRERQLGLERAKAAQAGKPVPA